MKKLIVSAIFVASLALPAYAQTVDTPLTHDQIVVQLQSLMQELMAMVQQLTDQLNAKMSEQNAKLDTIQSSVNAVANNSQVQTQAPLLGAVSTSIKPIITLKVEWFTPNEQGIDAAKGIVNVGDDAIFTVKANSASQFPMMTVTTDSPEGFLRIDGHSGNESPTVTSQTVQINTLSTNNVLAQPKTAGIFTYKFTVDGQETDYVLTVK